MTPEDLIDLWDRRAEYGWTRPYVTKEDVFNRPPHMTEAQYVSSIFSLCAQELREVLGRGIIIDENLQRHSLPDSGI
jgi:hypothetical protein